MPNYSTVFLDLDDTLYPPDSGVWHAIGERIVGYLTNHLSLSERQAIALREEYTRRYGTTLKGLIENHAVEPQGYMDYVHDLPVSQMLSPDPALRRMLAALPQDIYIFTNADQSHAGRVTDALGITSEIDGIIGYFEMAPHNKPDLGAYQKALELAGRIDPSRCILADDQLVNLEVAARIGMMTVLVGNGQPARPSHLQISRITDLLKGLPDLLRPTPGDARDA